MERHVEGGGSVSRRQPANHMTDVKSWLNRARRLDDEINTLLGVRQAVHDRLVSITQNYDSDGAQSTKDPHKYDKLVEIDGNIDQRIDQLIQIRQEIFQTIQMIDDSRYRQILESRYIAGWTWERIAVSINYSYKQTIRLHGFALRAIEPFIR